MNIMDGPGPSSVATRVIGTGLLENLGWEAWREREGRSDLADVGRPVLNMSSFGDLGSLRELGLLPEASELAFKEVARLEIDAGFLLGLPDLLNERSGSEAAGGLIAFLRLRSGTLISLSPVDFLDGGGPLIESPWLLRLLSLALVGD